MEIVSILLDQPKLSLQVHKDGTPNWEIMKETEAVEKTVESETDEFSLTLQRYEIRNATFTYADDETGQVYRSPDDNSTIL